MADDSNDAFDEVEIGDADADADVDAPPDVDADVDADPADDELDLDEPDIAADATDVADAADAADADDATDISDVDELGAETESLAGSVAESTGDEKKGGPRRATKVAAATVPAVLAAMPEDMLLKDANRIASIIIVDEADRQSGDMLTPVEAALIISARSRDIERDQRIFIKTKHIHAIDIAKAELFARRCPYRLRRPVATLPNGDTVVEEWDVRTMILPEI